MNSTCARCGAVIDNSYPFDGKYYGSTCYKVVLKEKGILTGYQPKDYDKDSISKVVAIIKGKGSKWDKKQKAKGIVSNKAYRSICFVISNRYNPHHPYNQYIREILEVA